METLVTSSQYGGVPKEKYSGKGRELRYFASTSLEFCSYFEGEAAGG